MLTSCTRSQRAITCARRARGNRSSSWFLMGAMRAGPSTIPPHGVRGLNVRPVPGPVCALPHLAGFFSVRRDPRQQARGLPAHDFVALARELLELGAVEHADLPAPIADDARLLQLARRFRHALAAHAEHARDELLGH